MPFAFSAYEWLEYLMKIKIKTSILFIPQTNYPKSKLKVTKGIKVIIHRKITWNNVPRNDRHKNKTRQKNGHKILTNSNPKESTLSKNYICKSYEEAKEIVYKV